MRRRPEERSLLHGNASTQCKKKFYRLMRAFELSSLSAIVALSAAASVATASAAADAKSRGRQDLTSTPLANFVLRPGFRLTGLGALERAAAAEPGNYRDTVPFVILDGSDIPIIRVLLNGVP
ncbi:MAG: hypothetical protein LC772_01840, partial [Chloroflexi bacterium]|nr:hypothetical protein [Chloroflexota bacterium]